MRNMKWWKLKRITMLPYKGDEDMFGEDFLFGASLSGFQFEMGRTSPESIDRGSDWYVWAHDKLNIENGIVSGTFPESGPNYWTGFEEFHRLAAGAGMKIIRIGLEWSRILPKPTFERWADDLDDICNTEAIEHYRGIIGDIRNRGMKVIVNLNHFSLPIWLHEPIRVNRYSDFTAGGWADPRAAEEFRKFAGLCGRRLGDIVDMWSTENEPNVLATLGYRNRASGFPPSIIRPELARVARDNLINAHLLGYEELKKETSSPVGLIYAISWIDGEERAVDSALKAQFEFIDRIKDSTDFLGLNYYSRMVVESDEESDSGYRTLPGFGQGCKPNSLSRSGRPTSDFGWEIYPEGLYNILKTTMRRYDVPVFVTENGIADATDGLRPYYLIGHLKAVEKLIEEGFSVKGYMHWSLTDNYEWASGLGMRFGLVSVDFKDGSLTPRPSYYLLKEIIKQGSVNGFKKMLKEPYDIFDETLLIE